MPGLLALAIGLLAGGCANEEKLRREDPVAFWKATLKREFAPGGESPLLRSLTRDDVTALTALLEGSDEFYQWTAAQTLGATRAFDRTAGEVSAARPALEKLLGSRNVKVRASAAAALGSIGKESLPALLRALDDKEVVIRSIALTGIGEMGPDAREAAPALKKLLADKDLRPEAAEALIRIGEPGEAIPVLAEGIRAKDPKDRLPAAEAIGRLCPRTPEGIEALLAAIDNSSPKVRGTVLAELRCEPPVPPEVFQALLRRLKDPYESIRFGTLHILEGLGDQTKTALDPIAACLKDKASDVRWMAARVLARIGPDARPAADALRELLKDDDKEVRGEAEKALEAIEGKGPAPKEK
jgi:HEAT repeat protein